MTYYHVSQINVDLFWVYSSDADYEYIVNIANKENMDKAMEIAEREATRWGGPDSEELGDDYDYYFNAGYVEVVEDAFKKEGIDAYFYTKMESRGESE